MQYKEFLQAEEELSSKALYFYVDLFLSKQNSVNSAAFQACDVYPFSLAAEAVPSAAWRYYERIAGSANESPFFFELDIESGGDAEGGLCVGLCEFPVDLCLRQGPAEKIVYLLPGNGSSLLFSRTLRMSIRSVPCPER
jgi:hypothetical protein